MSYILYVQKDCDSCLPHLFLPLAFPSQCMVSSSAIRSKVRSHPGFLHFLHDLTWSTHQHVLFWLQINTFKLYYFLSQPQPPSNVSYHPLLLDGSSSLLNIFQFLCLLLKISTSTYKEESLKHIHQIIDSPSKTFQWFLISSRYKPTFIPWPQDPEWLNSPFLLSFSLLLTMLHHAGYFYL